MMNGVLAIIPGITITTIIGYISIWISDYIGINILGFEKSPISSVMVAIVMGILISNIFELSHIFQKGINFAVKKILKFGIILLGIRLSIIEVLRLGMTGIPIVIICIIGGITVAVIFAKWMNLPRNLGILIGVGTSICGVSAIVAAGPSINAKKEEITYAIAVITVFGIFATILYPYIVNFLFAGDPVKAGLFLGTSIHDTSQVTGAGLLYAEVFNQQITLDVAVVTKLVRNVFMVIMIPLMSFLAKKT
ncbi:MAG: putative sulfate exporter family transporter, partial [Thermotogota bacterium]|nr:putative sulfate exporter family transporter [Thermotogota bacterium]